MTIDEAQIMLKAKAKCIERICKGIYEDCNEQKCDNCDLCYAQGTNGEQIELMLQCAEWLEELKAIKSDGFTDDLLNMGFTKGYSKALEELKVIKEMDLSIPQHFTKEQSDWIKKYCINRNKEFYNKAIDDAKSVILQTLDNEILVDTLHLRLEQLKEKYNE
ncbi:MAG: hypothetical protein SPK49_01085 [Erysipelotrichaceae bacterium]|nr:hypothetical protein [Erysipelotrichaceae bacterium]